MNRANKNSGSLRTTVPSSIIKQFELQEGDKLRWWLESDKKGGILIRIESVSGESTGREGVGV